MIQIRCCNLLHGAISLSLPASYTAKTCIFTQCVRRFLNTLLFQLIPHTNHKCSRELLRVGIIKLTPKLSCHANARSPKSHTLASIFKIPSRILFKDAINGPYSLSMCMSSRYGLCHLAITLPGTVSHYSGAPHFLQMPRGYKY